MFLKHVIGRRVFIGVLLTVVLSALGIFILTARSRAPALEISFSHFQRESDYTVAIVKMRNTGSKPVCYWGSAVDSPYYDLMSESNGQWRESGPGWCGLGAREVLLHPGQVARIRVPTINKEPIKVGVRFRARTVRDLLPKPLMHRLPVKWQYIPANRAAWSEPIWPEALR